MRDRPQYADNAISTVVKITLALVYDPAKADSIC